MPVSKTQEMNWKEKPRDLIVNKIDREKEIQNIYSEWLITLLLIIYIEI